jgi:hypothetical protein
MTNIVQRALAITHHDKLAGAALRVLRTAARAIRVYSISFASSSNNKNISETVYYSTLRAVPREVERGCYANSNFPPDTARKAMNDAPHVGERYIEALNFFLVVKALKHPNQFISIPRIKLYTVMADEEDGFSRVAHALGHSLVACTRVLDCVGHAVL